MVALREMTELDHLGFAVRQIEPLLALFRRLGFAPTQPRELKRLNDRGQLEALGQISAHLVFEDTYIELSGVPDPAAGNHLERFLDRYEGLHILALRGADLDQARRRCLAAGLNPTDVQLAGRRIEYGNRHGEARFRWWMLPADDMPDGLVCHVDNLTPELVYQAAVQRHPNGALAISAVIVNTPDVPFATRRWQSALGIASVADARFALGNAGIQLCDLSSQSPELPNGLAGMAIRVKGLNGIRERLPVDGCVVVEETSATLTLRLPPPANALVVFHTD
jgi:hypothetical protein